MYVKYPKTPHLPWSQGVTTDDRTLGNFSLFEGEEVIVTEKMDGECTSMYTDHIHARSIDSRHHPSRDWVKRFWSENVAGEIPHGFRVCGENVYATHSIHYTNLESFFLGFGVWGSNYCMSWKATVEWFELLNISHVPVLWRGVFDKGTIKEFWKDLDDGIHEGYVVRLTREFSDVEFPLCIAKFVRREHVQTDEHWMRGQVVPNELKKS